MYGIAIWESESRPGRETARESNPHRYSRALHTTQGHHLLDNSRAPVSDGRQQLAVKAAETVAEGLPLDWVRVDLQRVALQEQHEDAPSRLRVNEIALLVLVVVTLLEKVQAVLHEAQRYGPLPLARDRAAVLARE